MDDKSKKNLTIIVVAIVIVAAMGIGAYYLTKDKNDNNDVTVKFIVEDSEGVYFWVEGKTSSNGNVMDAWENAVETYSFLSSFEKSTSTEGAGIASLFGLATTQDSEGNWLYWSQYTWTNNEWENSNLYMSNQKAIDNEYFGMIYGDGINTLSVTPDDVAILKSNLTDYKFLIESSSGLYFEASASGTNAYNAIISICNTYNIPYEANGTYLSSMFDLEWDGTTNYWGLFTYDNDWAYSNVNLPEITSTSDYLGLYYSAGVNPTVTP